MCQDTKLTNDSEIERPVYSDRCRLEVSDGKVLLGNLVT